MNAERNAKSASTQKTGLFATLRALLRAKGSGAPSPKRARLAFAAACASLIAAAALLGGSSLTFASAAEACPNEQLRSEDNSTQLPDCRSWELASPAFKAGNRANPFQFAADGNRFISASTGVYAGSQGETLSGLYMSERTGSGWQTESIDPPSFAYPFQLPLDSSADLTRSIFFSRHPTESVHDQNIYLREPNGDFVEIGPVSPPEKTAGPPAGTAQEWVPGVHSVSYEGASADLSHVIYSIIAGGFDFPVHGLSWPGDTTRGPSNTLSAYEYVGTGNTHPELLAVSDGTTVVKGNTVPSGTLITECGSSLGADGTLGSKYNAISADGETVFVTTRGEGSGICPGGGPNPAANEIYARIGRAETVAISEPTMADCSACDTEEANQENAYFQGASSDGSRVFFASEQQLFSGSLGEAGVNLYSYDFNAPAGEKITFISPRLAQNGEGVSGVARISQDGSHVYFVSQGTLASANAEGNSPSAGAANLYIYERDAAHPAGRTAFIATLCTGEGESGTLTGLAQCPSFRSDQIDWRAQDYRPVQATPDGRFLVFQSAGDLTPGDSSAVRQIFEYDAQGEELIRVSVGEAGYADGAASADANEAEMPRQSFSQTSSPPAANALAVSNDGSTVLFESAAALTPGALNASQAEALSTYEYRSSGALATGSVHLLSDGSGTKNSFAFALSAVGRDAFFWTAEPLLAIDGDGQPDTYDARAEGGFPAAAAAPGCGGESGCRGPASSEPTEPAPVTPGFHGPGNSHLGTCKKGLVRRHGKCVKKHQKKRHGKRAASHNRRGQK
jgi:hypothetical protein